MINTEMRVRCRAVDAARYSRFGHACEKWTPWKKNLIFDQTLNAFANKSGGIGATNGSSAFSSCQVGTSAAAQTFPSGIVTFTQVGTTITASGSFFTAGMVGAIIKYGAPGTSNGAEQYIVSQTGTQCVVSGAGMTQTTTAGTVFLVQQTALVAPLLSTATYQTSGTSCGTTFVNNQVTHQRTFNFAVQVSSYNANEIGWLNGGGTANSLGRLVLASTIVVGTTQFLQVQLQMVITYSPGTPTAVGNVGTGLNTAGNAMLENFGAPATSCITQVTSSGGTTSASGNIMDGSNLTAGSRLYLRIGATYTQNSNTANGVLSAPSWAGNLLISATDRFWVYTAASVGICTLSFTTETFSTTGQTLFGLGLQTGGNTIPCFDVKLTTTATLPTGTYQPQCVFTLTYTRSLVC